MRDRLEIELARLCREIEPPPGWQGRVIDQARAQDLPSAWGAIPAPIWAILALNVLLVASIGIACAWPDNWLPGSSLCRRLNADELPPGCVPSLHSSCDFTRACGEYPGDWVWPRRHH